MPFQKSTGLEKYTASSYDVDKVIPIHRSDFKCPKLVKQSLVQYDEALFTFPGCVYHLTNESMTRVPVPSTGARNTSHCGDEMVANEEFQVSDRVTVTSKTRVSVNHSDVNHAVIDLVPYRRQDESCVVNKALHTLPGALHKKSQKSNQISCDFSSQNVNKASEEHFVSSSKIMPSTEQVTNLHMYNKDYYDSESGASNTFNGMAGQQTGASQVVNDPQTGKASKTFHENLQENICKSGNCVANVKLSNKKAFVPIVQQAPNSVTDRDDFNVKSFNTENRTVISKEKHSNPPHPLPSSKANHLAQPTNVSVTLHKNERLEYKWEKFRMAKELEKDS